MSDFWTSTYSDLSTEADVETRIVLPLLRALGYELRDIRPKQPVEFQHGRTRRPGRKPEADFVVYSELPHTRDTALIVVEAKRPTEKLEAGKEQAESYAQNLRTPLFILTNGVTLEFWQLQRIGESELVLTCSLEKLADKRGDIEAIASRNALLALSDQLRFKNLATLAQDLSSYVRSETERCRKDLRGHVSFSLQRLGANEAIAQDALFSDLRDGAIVAASSGYGKTLLSKAVMFDALEDERSGRPLPIEVFLPDLPDEGLEAYLLERVTAHSPRFNAARLRQEAQSNGLLVIADGFDRVPAPRRAAVTSQLRNFVRDFPRSRLVVFSRPNCLPDLKLPLLKLEGFRDVDVLSLIRMASPPTFRNDRLKLPAHLLEICRIPLLGSLVADHYLRHHRFPTKISSLYEGWLERVLDTFPAMEKAIFRDFLERLAERTVKQPLDIAACLEMAEGIGRENLASLTDAEAISVRGTQVELIHEGLADFLRAQRIVRLPPNHLQAALDEITLDPSSLFPGLLLTASPSDEITGIIWRALAKKGLDPALSSLKFTIGDGERCQISDSTATATKVLTDVLEAIECLISSNFSDHLGNLIRRMIAGQKIERLGLKGQIREGFLNYSGFDAGHSGPRICVGADENAQRSFGIALDKQGYDAQAGRVLGAIAVQKGLGELIKYRWFKGGPIWTEEKVFGQLRHLAQRQRMNFTPPYHLPSCLRELTPWKGRRIGPSSIDRFQLIDFSELLDDIEWLVSRGCTQLAAWWIEPSAVDLSNPDHRRQLASTLDIYHRRCQAAYSEIVQRELPGLTEMLPEYRCIPMMYELEATALKSDRGDRLVLEFQRWPVKDIRDAGAKVVFPERSSRSYSPKSMDAYVKRSEELLTQLGRSRSQYHIVRGGATVPRFDGRTYMHMDNEDETAVVSAVMNMLAKDCKQVFGSIPTFPWT
ncbi:NACHT domain-containing protein [Sinorhizobium medicae]|uniref:type I restriction enzyme HsdR N-terminal domain-containing protein n=1 Tax=Sinorhizobium medicae TaxID=110321 RepID=UPI000C7D40CA|nr:type I restriction enzyme HsdR N-terminal domain-containing protein [Sinorhizobium medicae]PLU43044.1 hypothetical protein BMJ25_28065 [Sinorhizobium medicae]RVQ47366.1 NACHT domain-containing protein [Sinorhizobium medicae]